MTSPDPERLAVCVPEHVVYRDFAEQTVALNLQTGRYHGLNPTAAAMVDALREAPNVAAAAERLGPEWDVEVTARNVNTVRKLREKMEAL